jgi:hypothetical protein
MKKIKREDLWLKDSWEASCFFIDKLNEIITEINELKSKVDKHNAVYGEYRF